MNPTREDVLEYLDELSESGITDMFGASAYLLMRFDLTKEEAMAFLSDWKKTQGERIKK
jgi:hypothetical protein